MIIGVVGSIASGKDTVAEYFENKGFQAISFSDILREIMKKEGLDTSVKNMTEYGNALRETKGYDYLARQAFKKINKKNAVLTSIRQVGEIEFLRTKPDFHLIRVDAPIELRLKRLIDRKRLGDIKNLKELKEIEKKQADGTGGGMNMNKCYKLADYKIINDGTLQELQEKVEKVLAKIDK